MPAGNIYSLIIVPYPPQFWHFNIIVNQPRYGMLFYSLPQNKVMRKQIEKVETNTPQHNFNASREVSYWANKYNTSLDEIQQIFEQSGYSISRTIAELQKRENAA